MWNVGLICNCYFKAHEGFFFERIRVIIHSSTICVQKKKDMLMIHTRKYKPITQIRESLSCI